MENKIGNSLKIIGVGSFLIALNPLNVLRTLQQVVFDSPFPTKTFSTPLGAYKHAGILKVHSFISAFQPKPVGLLHVYNGIVLTLVTFNFTCGHMSSVNDFTLSGLDCSLSLSECLVTKGWIKEWITGDGGGKDAFVSAIRTIKIFFYFKRKK